jgi:dTDP-4-amino-4,6-dideoxy-D-galactose acyltransferase
MIEFLEWDSNFFDLRIGKIELKTKLNIDEVHDTSYDLIYVFNSSERKLEILGNQKSIDIKCNFSLNLGRIPKQISKTNFVDTKNVFTPEEVNDLVNLTIESGFYSRYFLDNRFKKDDFKNLYTYWLKSSLNNEAKKLFFVKMKNKIIALLILKFQNENSIIDILSVSKHFRRLGIARDLVVEAINYSIANDFKILHVSTQKKNKIACDFYISNGFRKVNEIEIFHIWTK